VIQRKPDFVTLFYIDSNGNEVSANPMTWTRYGAMLTILSAQLQAVIEDKQAIANYHNLLGSYQGALNNGQVGLVAPVKPQHKVIDDATGAVSWVPFVPPLPDAIIPVLAPSTGTIANPNPPADRTDVLLGMVMALMADVKAIKDKVGA